MERYKTLVSTTLANCGLVALVLPLLGWGLPQIVWVPIGVILLLAGFMLAPQKTGLLWTILLVATFLPWGKQFDLGTPLFRQIFIPTYLMDVFLLILFMLTVWELFNSKLIWKPNWMDLGLLLCVIATFLSLYNAPDTSAVWMRVSEWLRGWLFLFVARLRLNRNLERDWFLNTLVVMLIIQGAFVVFTSISGNNLGLWDKPGGSILMLLGGRMAIYRAGSMVEPNVVSQIASLWLTLVVALLLFSKRKKWLLWLVLAGCLLSLLLSYSRAGWLTTTASLGLMVICWLIAKPVVTKPKLIMAIVVVIVMLALAGLGILFLNKLSESSITSAFSRVGMSQIAIGMWHDHPWLGIGAGNYLDLVLFYNPTPTLFFPVHNFYLEVLAETGLVGCFAVAVLILGMLIPSSITAIGQLRCGKWTVAAIWCGLVGLWMRLVVTMSFHDPTVLAHLFLAAGLVFALAAQKSTMEEEMV